MLGVPTDVKRMDGSHGQDTVQFNAHRYQYFFCNERQSFWCLEPFRIPDYKQNSWTSALKSLKNRTYLKIKSMGSTRRRPVEFYLQHTFRIYGPRLYPYLTTNWKFIWPNPGKRWAFQIWMGCSDLCAGKAPKMRGDGGRGSLSYAGNINRFSYSARLELNVFLYFYLFAIFTQIYLRHP